MRQMGMRGTNVEGKDDSSILRNSVQFLGALQGSKERKRVVGQFSVQSAPRNGSQSDCNAQSPHLAATPPSITNGVISAVNATFFATSGPLILSCSFFETAQVLGKVKSEVHHGVNRPCFPLLPPERPALRICLPFTLLGRRVRSLVRHRVTSTGRRCISLRRGSQRVFG